MYVASTPRKCRWPKISMRSVSSALTVRTNRSAKQFARGQRGGIFDHADAGIGQDRIKRHCELAGAVPDEEPELGDTLTEIDHQVADLLGGPLPVRVRGRPQQVHGSCADLQHEEYVDPLQRDRAVHVEEITGQHG